MTRRNAIQLAASAGLTAAIGAEGEAQEAKDEKKPITDRDFVLAAGMTPDEADCWAATAERSEDDSLRRSGIRLFGDEAGYHAIVLEVESAERRAETDSGCCNQGIEQSQIM
jgi:hypothetical protein